MSIVSLYERLKVYGKKMLFFEPASQESINDFQTKQGIQLPKSYVELISCFDGGEIFIPGTTIFGINKRENERNIKEVNGKNARGCSKMPRTLMIIGKLNFGDWICMDLNSDEIVQWDHESDEEFCKWNSLEEWLKETIEEFDKYCGEES